MKKLTKSWNNNAIGDQPCSGPSLTNNATTYACSTGCSCGDGKEGPIVPGRILAPSPPVGRGDEPPAYVASLPPSEGMSDSQQEHIIFSGLKLVLEKMGRLEEAVARDRVRMEEHFTGVSRRLETLERALSAASVSVSDSPPEQRLSSCDDVSHRMGAV